MIFKNTRSNSATTMKTTVMTRFTGCLSAVVIAGLLTFALPDTSEAQSFPQAPSPERTQPLNDPPPQPPSPPGPPAQTPIDGGLGLLLAAGGAYGLNKLRKRRKEGSNH